MTQTEPIEAENRAEKPVTVATEALTLMDQVLEVAAGPIIEREFAGTEMHGVGPNTQTLTIDRSGNYNYEVTEYLRGGGKKIYQKWEVIIAQDGRIGITSHNARSEDYKTEAARLSDEEVTYFEWKLANKRFEGIEGLGLLNYLHYLYGQIKNEREAEAARPVAELNGQVAVAVGQTVLTMSRTNIPPVEAAKSFN
ncbi:MAG TPA: hypothetical protein VFB03_04020 [Candidatus Saccharimonadales bacterium]|nr:hypothetical protein [Candidatus Saccharimonadales bacterium]